VCQVATECSWNDGSKTQYYIVILDRLPGCSRGLERALEWRVRGPLTDIDAVDQCLRDLLKVSNHLHLIALELIYYLE